MVDEELTGEALYDAEIAPVLMTLARRRDGGKRARNMIPAERKEK